MVQTCLVVKWSGFWMMDWKQDKNVCSWSKMSGIQMVCPITWSDHLKTGQSVRKVECSDFRCTVFRCLLYFQYTWNVVKWVFNRKSIKFSRLVQWGLEYRTRSEFQWGSMAFGFLLVFCFEQNGGHLVQYHSKSEQNGRYFLWISNGLVFEWSGP